MLTNALSRLSLYVDVCRCVEMRLGTKWDVLNRELCFKSISNEHFGKENTQQIKEGYKLFDHLITKKAEYDNVKIWFSAFSRIELLNIFLERTFDRQLTRNGVPFRVRLKKPLRTQINFDYNTEVFEYWIMLKSELENSDIELMEPERLSGAVKDILRISDIITRYVALDVIDLYLYASSIFIRANELYCHDIEFRWIVRNIQKENGEKWKNISRNIQNDLKNSFSWIELEFEEKGLIALPEGNP